MNAPFGEARELRKDTVLCSSTAGCCSTTSGGSGWLSGWCEEWLPGASKILNWHHVSEHVAKTAHTLFATETDDAEAFDWREHKMELLRTGAVSEALGKLLTETNRPDVGADGNENPLGLHTDLVRPRA